MNPFERLASDGQNRAHTKPSLVKCADHKYAPWCVVCTHVFTKTATAYVRVPGGMAQQDDYLCPACYESGPGLGVDDLKCVCIHCARNLVESLAEQRQSDV